MTVSTAKQTSVVTNKEQYYLILESHQVRYTMSVGQKTFTVVNEMINSEKPEAKLNKDIEEEKLNENTNKKKGNGK